MRGRTAHRLKSLSDGASPVYSFQVADDARRWRPTWRGSRCFPILARSAVVVSALGCGDDSKRTRGPADASEGSADVRILRDAAVLDRATRDALGRGDGRPFPDGFLDGPGDTAAVSDVALQDAGFPPDASREDRSDASVVARDASTDGRGVVPIDAAEADARDGGSDAALDCEPFTGDECPADAGLLPMELRCTGLYGDWEKRTIACGVRAYSPAHALWSDGAEKHRYVWLPEGALIDATDPDALLFPVGTKFWKEFRVPADAGLLLGETRLLRKTESGWLYTAYVWTSDGQDAIQTNDGVVDLHGTGHTVPTRDQCVECHAGRRDFILGWDSVLLGEGATGLTLDELVAAGVAATSDAGLPNGAQGRAPGDATESAALGYLHANCGVSCHNPSPGARAQTSGLYLQLQANTQSALDAPAVVTGVNRLPSPLAPLGDLQPPPAGSFYDLLPMDPGRSLLLARMKLRDHVAQMPRIGTNRVDEAGVRVVTAWIEAMTAERGYPPALP